MVDLGKTLKLAWYKNELLSFDRIPIFNDLLVHVPINRHFILTVVISF